MAKDVWYARGGKNIRITRDVDFAILAGSQEQYDAVKAYLKEHKQFVATKDNYFVMLAPDGTQVDILPFGEIEIDDKVVLIGEGLATIHVNGFKEVFESGTREMKMETGHIFKIATLPAVVLLKIIAFDDRPENRMKDPRDVAGIIQNFFDLEADLVYTYTDLFADDNEEKTLQEIAAIVIGREIKKIAENNPALLDRLRSVLQNYIDGKEDSPFIRQMVAESGKPVETNVHYLENILAALKGSEVLTTTAVIQAHVVGSAGSKKDQEMIFNAKERSKAFLFNDQSSILELKKIALSPLFEWKQPTEWGSVLSKNNLYLQIDCVAANGNKISPSPISIHAGPMDRQPVFEWSPPLQLPDYVWEAAGYKMKFPVTVTISLVSQKEKIDFVVMIIYDEASVEE